MPILLDDREDPTLRDYLSSFGLPYSVVRLDYGDLVIQSSNGWLIGYERKRIMDLINSMQDRRLSGHQLKGMHELYDRVELIVEGIWRAGDNGCIEIPNMAKPPGRNGYWHALFHRGSGISYRQVDSYLCSLCECAGVAVWRTSSTVESAHLYASRYHWWQKDYDLHKSHDVLFTTSPLAQHRGAVLVQRGEASLTTLMAAQIPGIDAKSWDVGAHFGSPQDMCNADEREWRTVAWTDRKGNVKHFGKDTAREIVQKLKKGSNKNI